MDFVKIRSRIIKSGEHKGSIELYPDLIVGKTKDLMIRGKSFYAVWDETVGLWSTDEYAVQKLIDRALYLEREELSKNSNLEIFMQNYGSFNTNEWTRFKKYIQSLPDNYIPLDSELTFLDQEISRNDYRSKRLPYSLGGNDYESWNNLIGTLYSVDERAKIEWSIGAIVAGEAKDIHKFLVFYGPPGSGKSTIMNIISKLFEGYVGYFDANALATRGDQFATDAFRNNPLVGIQHDGDLSTIEDNTVLNSITAHEPMKMNEKFKASYTDRVNAFLFMGTNKPVKITDAKSGMGRRLIDVHPTGVKIPITIYRQLMKAIDFELGAIAQHCLDVYRAMGPSYYDEYSPVEMMLQTDIFYNFIEAYYDIFKDQDYTTLKQAYALYKDWCAEANIRHILPQYRFRDELRNYFHDFTARGSKDADGNILRSVYSGFTLSKYRVSTEFTYEGLNLDQTESIFDSTFADRPAQYAREDEYGNEIPFRRWAFTNTILSEIDTSKVHFVKVPENHIVIDFDLKDGVGNKSRNRNLEAAASWPPTYSEYSKSGGGLHLHYIYDGDVSMLSREYSEGIEVKVYSGNASLRRRLSKCNNLPIATISGGLPLKEVKLVEEEAKIKTEKSLRRMIDRNLRKEIHPGTKPSVDFIHKILEDAYLSGMQYDVSDLRGLITTFAANSTNQPAAALKMASQMKYKSDESIVKSDITKKNEKIVYFDCEVFPNLFVICWKYEKDPVIVKMINPSPAEVEKLFDFNLVGFNNRQYDNHILYARHLGYSNEALYNLSQKIINGDRNAKFGEAYDLSYTDILDFSSKKQSLKKFQIELGIKHVENELPWNEPVPEERIMDVVEYCANDVETNEAVFNARYQDFMARKILSELSGLSPNATTSQHTAKIIFEGNRRPQADFIYTDLSTIFPGYKFDKGVSTYKGFVTGEGGFVYSKPGIWEDVASFDVTSMHPTSIINLMLFGKYTKNFRGLYDARLAIKHKQYDKLDYILDGKLKKYVGDDDAMAALAYALKIVINIVYGLTKATFDSPFRDIRNKDNIVAKIGALFMIDLKEYLESEGMEVIHIKTDGIKIANFSRKPEMHDKIMEFGRKYGYEFEYEQHYSVICLVNDAVYIARSPLSFSIGKDDISGDPIVRVVDDEVVIGRDKWSAIGAQFAHPAVFKTLFTEEELVFDDFCETKEVTSGTSLYLDFNYKDRTENKIDDMIFVGRTGRFVPVKEEFGGGILYRVKDGKFYAATGTKGYLWKEANMTSYDEVDLSYFETLSDKAIATINKFGSYEDLFSVGAS